MPKKILYMCKSKPPLHGYAVFFNKPPVTKWDIVAKLEITSKILTQYDKKIEPKRIYGIVGKEFGIAKWNI